jgi:hypothetical protein
VVAESGDCIRSIREIFDRAFRMAAEIYQRAVRIQGVEAELATVPGKPVKINGNSVTVTGKAIWNDVGASRYSQVQVIVNAREFDQRGLNILPYCITHELISHVFQQAGGVSPRQGEPEEYDALAEGWMDYIAAELVAGGPAAVDHGPWNNPAIAEAARWMHSIRRDQTGPDPFEYAPKVALGWEAAFWVLRIFRCHQVDADLEQDPWDDFVDLSCQLNAYPWDEFDRGEVLAKLPRRLGRVNPDLGEERPEIDKDLVDALTRWRVARGGNPDAIEKVIAAMRKSPS